jgi:hypothetical protein
VFFLGMVKKVRACWGFKAFKTNGFRKNELVLG